MPDDNHTNTIYQEYEFPENTDEDIIIGNLCSAVVDGQIRFGFPEVRRVLAYCFSPAKENNGKAKVTIDVTTDVGKYVADVFNKRMKEDG